MRSSTQLMIVGYTFLLIANVALADEDTTSSTQIGEQGGFFSKDIGGLVGKKASIAFGAANHVTPLVSGTVSAVSHTAGAILGGAAGIIGGFQGVLGTLGGFADGHNSGGVGVSSHGIGSTSLNSQNYNTGSHGVSLGGHNQGGYDTGAHYSGTGTHTVSHVVGTGHSSAGIASRPQVLGYGGITQGAFNAESHSNGNQDFASYVTGDNHNTWSSGEFVSGVHNTHELGGHTQGGLVTGTHNFHGFGTHEIEDVQNSGVYASGGHGPNYGSLAFNHPNNGAHGVAAHVGSSGQFASAGVHVGGGTGASAGVHFSDWRR